MDIDGWETVCGDGERRGQCDDERGRCFLKPCFNCSKMGMEYLQSGFLSRVLTQTEENILDHSRKLRMFGHLFAPTVICVPNSSEQTRFFSQFRYSLFEVMKSVLSPDSDEIVTLGELRGEVSNALYFCNSFISRDAFDVSYVEKFIYEIDNLCQCVGSLSKFMSHSMKRVQGSIALNTLYHIHLELSIHRLLMHVRLVIKHSDVPHYVDQFGQMVNAIVREFVASANQLFIQITSLDSSSFWDHNFFPCHCMKQSWTIIIHCLDSVSKITSQHSFWSVVSAILQSDNIVIRVHDTHSEKSFPMKYSAEFKIWLLSSISPLYWLDVSGNNTYNEKSSVPRNWQVVQELTQDVLSCNPTNETSVRSILWGCICLTKHWDIQLNQFNLLWNYFSKHITSSFGRNSGNVTSYMYKVSDLSEKFHQCKALMNNTSSILSKDASAFHCFLSYVVCVITKIKTKEEQHLLSQLKVRMYSKFHKQRMNELNSEGFENCVTLFTVVAIACGTDDVPKKMCSLFGFLNFKEKDNEMRKLLVKGYFLVLLACKQNSLPAEIFVGKARSLFTSILESLVDSRSKKDQYLQNWDVLKFYMDCVEKCLDYEKSISDEGGLICGIYKQLIKFVPNTNHRRQVYLHLKNLLSSSYVRSQKNALDHVWMNIYQPLSEVAICEGNQVIMAEMLSALTLLCYENLDLEKFVQLTDKFAFSEDNQLSFKCTYTGLILSNAAAVEKLILLDKSDALAKLWINATLQDLYKSSAVLELTRSLVASHQVLNWEMPRECCSPDDVEKILLKFILHLGNILNATPSWTELCQLKKRINAYFSGMIKISENLIFNSTCAKSLNLIFLVGGQLVASCYKAIYSKTGVCMLPEILSVFVLPIPHAKRPISSTVSKLMKLHLHMFLKGIVPLFSRADSFLLRKVNEILSKYFMETLTRPSDSQRNPFLMSLDASCLVAPSKTACEYRQCVLEYICERFQQLLQAPDQLVVVLRFIFELVQNTRSEEECIRTMEMVLLKIVSCLLVCNAAGKNGEPRFVRKLSMDILCRMVSNTKNKENCNETLRRLLHRFVADNLAHYQGAIMKTMQCMCLVSPVVMKSLISDIDELVMEYETKRGCGVDGVLREAFELLKSFATNLPS